MTNVKGTPAGTSAGESVDPATTEVIAHRGVAGRQPENTVPAFLEAISAGADAIELDVHGTRDGHLVVHHDPVLASPQGAPVARPIAELTLADIRASPLALGVGIPTLEEVLAAVARRLTVYVEVKAPGIEALVVGAIRESGCRCAVHSFDHRIVRRVADLAPDVPVGILSASYLLDPVAALRAVGARDYWQQAGLCDSELVSAIRNAGGRVIAWTVNDPAGARALAAAGVASVCTDTVAAVRAALRRVP